MSDLTLTRRHLMAAGAAGALAVYESRLGAFAAEHPRPNILWLTSEDHGPHIGAYGDTAARTPAIDRLATQGVRYSNFFPTAPVCAPSRFAIISGLHAESCGPAEHMRASGNIPDGLLGFPSFLRSAGYYCTNNFKTDYNAPIDVAATWDASGPLAHWRNRPAGKPFFGVFNFDITHELPEFANAATQTPLEDVRVPIYLPDTQTVRRDKAHHYDLIALMDSMVAQRLQELEDDGVAEDTIVFYYSDHGGLLPRSKRFCYDSGLHAPLIVRFPSKWSGLAPASAGTTIDRPVSGVDLAPTVLSLAGLPVPGYMQGAPFVGPRRFERRYAFGARNRMDERYDMVRTARDRRYRYIRNYMPHLIYGQHNYFAWLLPSYREWEQLYLDGALTEVQARFWRRKPAEELYDLEQDPDEVRNLARDPSYRKVRARMRRALNEHMLAINDNGFIPESSPLEGYDQSRAPGAYPLRKVMRLARRATRRDPARVPQLVRALDGDSEPLRYWAALGCAMLGGRAAAARRPLERRLEGDDSLPVRIAAAEALARMEATDRSVPLLADTLDSHPDVRVRLQAINALGNIGDRASPALASITAAAADTDEYIGAAARYTLRVLTGTYVPSP